MNFTQQYCIQEFPFKIFDQMKEAFKNYLPVHKSYMHDMGFGPVLGQHLWQLSRLAWKRKNVNATYLLIFSTDFENKIAEY